MAKLLRISKKSECSVTRSHVINASLSKRIQSRDSQKTKLCILSSRGTWLYHRITNITNILLNLIYKSRGPFATTISTLHYKQAQGVQGNSSGAAVSKVQAGRPKPTSMPVWTVETEQWEVPFPLSVGPVLILTGYQEQCSPCSNSIQHDVCYNTKIKIQLTIEGHV